jgi:hypothetical protein
MDFSEKQVTTIFRVHEYAKEEMSWTQAAVRA